MAKHNPFILYKVCYIDSKEFWPICAVNIFLAVILLSCLVCTFIIQLKLLKRSESKVSYLCIYITLFLKFLFAICSCVITSYRSILQMNVSIHILFYYLILVDFLWMSSRLKVFICDKQWVSTGVLIIATSGIILRTIIDVFDIVNEACALFAVDFLDFIFNIILVLFCIIFILVLSNRQIKSKLKTKENSPISSSIGSYDNKESARNSNTDPFISDIPGKFVTEEITDIIDNTSEMSGRVSLYEESDGAIKQMKNNVKWFMFAMAFMSLQAHCRLAARIVLWRHIYDCFDTNIYLPKSNMEIFDKLIGTILLIGFSIIINKFFYFDAQSNLLRCHKLKLLKTDIRMGIDGNASLLQERTTEANKVLI